MLWSHQPRMISWIFNNCHSISHDLTGSVYWFFKQVSGNIILIIMAFRWFIQFMTTPKSWNSEWILLSFCDFYFPEICRNHRACFTGTFVTQWIRNNLSNNKFLPNTDFPLCQPREKWDLVLDGIITGLSSELSPGRCQRRYEWLVFSSSDKLLL